MARRWAWLFAVFAAIEGITRSASAEEIVSPHAIAPIAPLYPADGDGDADVTLAVTVDADGRVIDVSVEAGREPFASAAASAARAARFGPAMREGHPVRATVRLAVAYRKTTSASAPEPPLPTDEVVVRGLRATRNAGSTFSHAEVRQLPGAFGDPFRALEVAPGVTPVLSGLPYYYVRGAPPGDVGFFLDGVRVPYLFHFGLGPAVVHPDLIAKSELYKGGYPAALGRYAGGVVDVTSMPPADRFHGEASIRAIDAGALVEAPFAGGKGTALAAGRYSYTAALFTLLQSDTALDYRDYQARVSYALDERDTVTLFAFGAYDLASQHETVDPRALGVATDPTAPSTPEGINRVLFASEFHRADVRLDRTWATGHFRVGATLGYDRTRVDQQRAAEDFITAARVELTQKVAPGVTLRAGTDMMIDDYASGSIPQFIDDDDVVVRQQAIFAKRVDWTTGARADLVLAFLPRIELVPGVRLDVFGSGAASAASIDPRLSARVAVTDRVRLVQAYGVATQPPATPVTLPAIGIARLQGGLQRAVQTSAGVEANLPADVAVTATAFHDAFYDLNDALGTSQLELVDIERSSTLLDKSRGSSFGLELGAQRKFTNRVSGLATYTLSRSRRTAGGQDFLSAYDRPHVVNLALSVDFGRGFRGGARFVGYSGVPVVAPTPAFAAQAVGIPPERTPPFFRLDLRFEKRWAVGARGWVALVLEGLNTTASREVTGYECGTALALPGHGTPTCRERVIGPIAVPSLGVEGGI